MNPPEPPRVLEPLPETAAAAVALEASTGESGILAELTTLAGQSLAVVPDLVGVSVARVPDDVVLTLVATPARLAELDARTGDTVDVVSDALPHRSAGVDVLDEELWRAAAVASAAPHVRSTLTLPLLEGGRAAGAVHLYAAGPHAFDGLYQDLAQIFGASAHDAVANADLPFATRLAAQAAPLRVREQVAVEEAAAIVAARYGVGADDAHRVLRIVATENGETIAQLARRMVDDHWRPLWEHHEDA